MLRKPLLVVCVLVVMTGPAIVDLSPVNPSVQAAAQAGRTGRFVWRDLVTHDEAGAKQFYQALFGWEYRSMTRAGRPYTLALLKGQIVGGIVQMAKTNDAAPQWVSYMAVADIARALDQVRAEKGRVIVDAVDAGLGRIAVVADPQGAPLGLIRLAREVPEQPSPLVGMFFWIDYLARDAQPAVEFYKQLAGYTASVTDKQGNLEYYVLKNDRTCGGLFQIPASETNVRPQWLPHVMVSDPVELAAKATQLGGKVLLAPRPDVRRGTLAIIADPTGAVVALQKWPL